MLTTVVLVTVGTPDPIDEAHVKDYLLRFLSDPNIVPYPFRKFIAKHVTNKRAPYLTDIYKKCAINQKSPLLKNLSELELHLRIKLDNKEQLKDNPALIDHEFKVVSACLYSEPFAHHIFREAFRSSDEVLIIPLFPQVCKATHESIYTLAIKYAIRYKFKGRYEVLWGFSDCSSYRILLAANLINWQKTRQVEPDTLLVSFHSLPITLRGFEESYYKDQCQDIFLEVEKHSIEHGYRAILGYQSKQGPMPWIKPYLSDLIIEEAMKDHNVAVFCPGFILECLETFYEVDTIYRERFEKITRANFDYIKAPTPAEVANLMHYFVLEFLKTKPNAQHKFRIKGIKADLYY